jgi:hypothetical protein
VARQLALADHPVTMPVWERLVIALSALVADVVGAYGDWNLESRLALGLSFYLVFTIILIGLDDQ